MQIKFNIPACQSAADIVFVVDSSGSIRDANPADNSYDNWELILNFINSIIDRLDIGEHATRVGLVSYSERARHDFFMNNYYDRSALKNAVESISYMGSFTNTSGGLRLMKDEQFTPQRGDRSSVRNIAIVITDGVSNKDADRTISDAVNARQKGVAIFSVGITNEIFEDELKGISSMPQKIDKQYFTSPNFDELDTITKTLVEQTCATPEATVPTTVPPTTPTTVTTTANTPTTSRTTVTTTTTTRKPSGTKQYIFTVYLYNYISQWCGIIIQIIMTSQYENYHPLCKGWM